MLKKKLTKDFALYFLATILTQLSNIILLPLYTRHLNPDQFAIMTLITVVSSIVIAICSLQLPSSIFRFFFDQNTESNKALYSNMLFFLSIMVLVGIVLMELAILPNLKFILKSHLDSYNYFYRIGFATASVNLLGQPTLLLMRAMKKTKLILNISAAFFFFSIGITWIFINVMPEPLSAILFSQLSLAILTTLTYFYISRDYLVLKLNAKILNGPMKYSVGLIPHAMMSLAFLYLDRFILERKVGLAALGIYLFAFKFSQIFKLPVNLLGQSFSPYYMEIAATDKEKAQRISGQILTACTFLFFCAWIFFTVFSNEITTYIFGEVYGQSAAIISALALTALFRLYYIFLSLPLFHEKKTFKISVISTVGAVANYTLLLWTVDRFGVNAAIGSSLASSLLIMILCIRFGGEKIFKTNVKSNIYFLTIGFLIYFVLCTQISEKLTINIHHLPFQTAFLAINLLIAAIIMRPTIKTLKDFLISARIKTT